jgi:hypothetical protein
MTEQPITLTDMVAEAKRELAMRRRVYPRWVEDGRMKPHQAERQIAALAAIVAELEEREMAAANEPETLL